METGRKAEASGRRVQPSRVNSPEDFAAIERALDGTSRRHTLQAREAGESLFGPPEKPVSVGSACVVRKGDRTVSGSWRLDFDGQRAESSAMSNGKPSGTKDQGPNKRFDDHVTDELFRVGGEMKDALESVVVQRKRLTATTNGDDLGKISLPDGPFRRSFPVASNDVAALAAFGVGAGLLANEVEIMRFTRALMDDDKAAVQMLLGGILDPARAKEVGVWMDSVPGQSVAGGWAHRLQSGHDLESLSSLVDEQGVGAAAHWFNHVYLRDFWTPVGVPWMSGGSGSAYEGLKAMGISPSTAMDLLSINAAEAASGLLFVGASYRSWLLAKSYWAASNYKEATRRVQEEIDSNNPLRACEMLEAMELSGSRGVSGALRLGSASLALQQSLAPNQSERLASRWATAAFFEADAVIKLDCEVIEGEAGLKTTSHGMAAQVICATATTARRSTPLEWAALESRMVSGVQSYVELAEEQALSTRWSLLSGYRPYSALLNLSKAHDLARASELSWSGLKHLRSETIMRRIHRLKDEIRCLGSPHSEFVDSIDAELARV